MNGLTFALLVAVLFYCVFYNEYNEDRKPVVAKKKKKKRSSDAVYAHTIRVKKKRKRY